MFNILNQLGNPSGKTFNSFEQAIDEMKKFKVGSYYLIPGTDALKGWIVEVDVHEVRVRDLGELEPFIIRPIFIEEK